MSESSTSARGRVVKVAAGLESTDRQVPVRDLRHEALGVLIGKWINEGHTVATPEVPAFTDGGLTQVAHHESSPAGVAWSASMEVTLRKNA